MHIREATVDAVVAHGEFFVIKNGDKAKHPVLILIRQYDRLHTAK
jgi:hypothetical protein